MNVIEVMPLAEFAGELSWGYNPACVFAVETNYGGPAGFKRFVKAVHRAGLGVILDVVYNHFGPGDLDLRQCDGWSENGLGGIYFYSDWRAETPWGSTRPDYGRKEVRQFIRRGLTKTAVYRDEQGALHERSAVCPHLGGIVHWNDAEKTWDCPCHGSRFDRLGGVLNGRANRDLDGVDSDCGK